MGGIEIMSKQHHYLKISPKHYLDILHNGKSFEVRHNDRNFKAQDILHLQEWTDSDGYSGREIIADVTYLLDDPNYCKEGYVIMAIKPFHTHFTFL